MSCMALATHSKQSSPSRRSATFEFAVADEVLDSGERHNDSLTVTLDDWRLYRTEAVKLRRFEISIPACLSSGATVHCMAIRQKS